MAEREKYLRAVIYRGACGHRYTDVMAARDKIALPAWRTLKSVRDDFLGPKAKCIMIIAPASEHVNLAEVHHIWHCPEGDGLPDFTRGTGSI